MDSRLNVPWLALRLGIGLTATLAGLDKFFNLLTNWSAYISPLAVQMLPVSPATFMGIVGIVELAVGIAVLTAWTRLGAYVASAWLILVALNLILAGYLVVAVCVVVMAIGAFTLARLTEVREEAFAHDLGSVAGHRRHATA